MMLKYPLALFGLSLLLLSGFLAHNRPEEPDDLMVIIEGPARQRRLSLLNPVTGWRRSLTPPYYDIFTLSFLDDGEEVFGLSLQTMTPNGTQTGLFRYHLLDEKLVTLADDLSGYPTGPIEISPGRCWLVYLNQADELVYVRTDGSGRTVISPPGLQIQRQRGAYVYLEYDPSLDMLYFSAVDGNNMDIYQMRPDGSDLRNLTVGLPQPHTCLRLYPLGKVVLVECDQQLYYSPLEELDFRQLMPDVELSFPMVYERDVANQRFTMQHRNSDDELRFDLSTGEHPPPYEVVQREASPLGRPVVETDEWQVNSEGYRPDGSDVFWLSKDGEHTEIIATLPVAARKAKAMADGRFLLFPNELIGYDNVIWRLSADGRRIDTIFQEPGGLAGLGVSPDGAWYYFAYDDTVFPPIPAEWELRRINSAGEVEALGTSWIPRPTGTRARNQLLGWFPVPDMAWSAGWLALGGGLLAGAMGWPAVRHRLAQIN
jgi:hypothetical protein